MLPHRYQPGLSVCPLPPLLLNLSQAWHAHEWLSTGFVGRFGLHSWRRACQDDNNAHAHVALQDDTNADAHVALGAALANTSKYEEALKQLETALVKCIVCVDECVVSVASRYLRLPRVCVCERESVC